MFPFKYTADKYNLNRLGLNYHTLRIIRIEYNIIRLAKFIKQVQPFFRAIALDAIKQIPLNRCT